MRSSPLATAMSGLMVLALIATLVLVLLLPMLTTLTHSLMATVEAFCAIGICS